MYITSFVHREELLDMTERWLCNRLESTDALRVSQILICDGFILGETLDAVSRSLLPLLCGGACSVRRLHFKGELRDMLCASVVEPTPRQRELIAQYHNNPDYFYTEAPIDGTAYVDSGSRLHALYRIKRPRRIAEKANRYIANHIFEMVQARAREMAEQRARSLGIPLEFLLTPEEIMTAEFTLAEETISRAFKEGVARFERSAVTINDAGGLKLVGSVEALARVEGYLARQAGVTVIEREEHRGNYQAVNFIIEVPWDREAVCRNFVDSRAWEKYLNRGIPGSDLRRGLESLFGQPEPRIRVELILTTTEHLVESELGVSIHEGRILTQRGQAKYSGYIPMNVEFLVEYLFAVALSPTTRIERLPVKLWGRYLPDTISYHIRQLYYLPEHDALY